MSSQAPSHRESAPPESAHRERAGPDGDDGGRLGEGPTGSGQSVRLGAILALGMAASTVAAHGLGVLGPFLTADLGLSRTALGSLTTVLFLTGSGLSPVAGPAVDRFGGRRCLLVLFGISAGCSLLASAAPSYGSLLVVVAVAGLGVALGNPATNQLLALHATPNSRGTLTGIKQSGVQASSFLAGVTLPRIAAAGGWRLGLAASALVGLVGLAVTRPLLPARVRTDGGHPLPRHGPAAADGEPGGPAGGTTTRPRLSGVVNRLSCYALLMGLGVGGTQAHLALYGVERLGLTRETAGLAMALTGLVGILARIGWGRFQDRSTRPIHRSLAALALGAVVSTVAIWAAERLGSAALALGAACFGGTALAWNSLGMLSIVADVPHSQLGRASGRVLLAFYGGFVVGPVAFGWAVDQTGGYALSWAAVLSLFALAAVVARGWPRTVRRSLEA